MFLRNLSKFILIVLYTVTLIISIVLQVIYFVPYEKSATFVSAQNVPHTIVIESGYTSLTKLHNDVYSSIYEVEALEDAIVSKGIDTAQLTTNLILTTVIWGTIYLALYFLFMVEKGRIFPKGNKREEAVEPPTIDFNELAFADPETQEKARKDYENAMYRYVKIN